MPANPLLLRAAGAAVILDLDRPRLPQVLHWGADPGPLSPAELAALPALLDPGVAHNSTDEPLRLSLVPGEPDGWPGRPGLAGHRNGTALFPRFTVTGQVLDGTPETGHRLTIQAADPEAGLVLESELRLEISGLVRIRHRITNSGDDGYTVNALDVMLPVPDRATEVLDLAGRWCREHSPQRQPFHQGSRTRESRRGRTGHDATLLMAAGTAGFGFRSGEIWAVHAAWSGNHVHVAEKLYTGAGLGGDGVLGAGELLLPGEIRLLSGQSYQTPWVVFSWSNRGLDGVSARLHLWLRGRPNHVHRPRPLVLNTWEAFYFEQDLASAVRLAERAAEVGVERFVLDDGWFRGRRNDRAGLGDWFVDPGVWPDGLAPLADAVRGLGMEFGLWVEPEMANPDSDLVRQHPDWILAAPGRWPALARQQLVVDLAHPAAYAYLLERLDALVTELGIAYLKWDHNRDLLESVHAGTGGVHVQTQALYRLMDELRARHPGLEIESCSSGGGRVDLGILERADRVWASDTNDPLERQPIQRWTGLLVPPELIGAHVGGPVAHTTHRATELSFRCLTALFGHAGIEWDLTTCTPDEVRQLQRWAALYRELRPLLHSGEVVRADPADDQVWLHGVVSPDRLEAVYACLRLGTSASALGGRLRLPGLDPTRSYTMVRRDEVGLPSLNQRRSPSWWPDGRLDAAGGLLADVGVAIPVLNPANGFVMHVRAS